MGHVCLIAQLINWIAIESRYTGANKWRLRGISMNTRTTWRNIEMHVREMFVIRYGLKRRKALWDLKKTKTKGQFRLTPTSLSLHCAGNALRKMASGGVISDAPRLPNQSGLTALSWFWFRRYTRDSRAGKIMAWPALGVHAQQIQERV